MSEISEDMLLFEQIRGAVEAIQRGAAKIAFPRFIAYRVVDIIRIDIKDEA